MQNPQKLPARKWLDRMLLPKNIDDLALYTALKSEATSIVTSLPAAWLVAFYLGPTARIANFGINGVSPFIFSRSDVFWV